MKVFLSWSGEVSKQVATALRDWLPNVIQAIEPWMSSEDIDKGNRWSSEVAKELDASAAGIVCVVPGNHDAPWLNFEAGAVSKAFGTEKVCPYLFRVKPADLTGPLVQFQLTEANKEETQRLLNSLNKGTGPKPLPDAKLAQAFEKWWPELQNQLAAIGQDVPKKEPRRSIEDVLEEILTLVREQSRRADAALKSSLETVSSILFEMRESWLKEMETHIERERQVDRERISRSIYEGAKEALGGGKLYQRRKTSGIPPPPRAATTQTQPTKIKPDEPQER